VRRVAAFAGARRRRRLEQLRLLRESPLFDPAWYLATYSDVAAAGADPAVHFLETGWLEGRDPGPQFATSAYLKANADVARQGLNPLLHYIEFGQFEGREIRGHPFTPWKRTGIVHHFDHAAPVFRGRPADETSAAWLSWHRLLSEDPDLLTVGAFPVGYARSAGIRASLDRRLGQVRHLSGLGGGNGDIGGDREPPALLVDGWYANDATLRTRWSREDFPFVVRALQADCYGDGEMRLVADALVLSPLDIVDLSLGDPYSPVFLVFAEPDGEIFGTRLLCFPSLCRGGLHYPELLALTPEGAAPDALAVGSALAARVVAAREGKRAICVDLSGADGKSPLFQPDFRRWLDRVAGVRVRPLADDGGSLAQLLKDAGPMADGKAGPVLASDMVPTISALTGVGDGEPVLAPLLIAQRDASQPVALVELPKAAPTVVAAGAAGYPTPWPKTLGANGKAPAAIRLAPTQARGEAELLVPASGASLPLNGGREVSITWLVDAHAFDVEAAQALLLQSAAAAHSIALVGRRAGAVGEEAAALFGDRAETFTSATAAVASTASDFVGYLARGVILHDNRAIAMLLSLLDDPDVASASCALVTAEKRGKGWHVGVAEAGALAGAFDPQRGWKGIEPRQLWRCTYPVVSPPRELWLARRQSAQAWLGQGRIAAFKHGSHVCTTLVTASYVKQRRRDQGDFRVPTAPSERALAARTLFG
jgi:hypothetical protein